MEDIGLLIFGVLIVAAVLALTAAIASVAPYIAGMIVVIALCWAFLWSNGEDEASLPGSNEIKPSE